MITLVDQLGQELEAPNKPNIISLVPSISKLVLDLEVKNQLIGITRFCDQPEGQRIEVIGGTKNPNLEKIKALKPDVILANKEENNKSDIDYLRALSSCYVSDIKTLEDNYQMISDIGRLLNRSEKAKRINYEIRNGFNLINIHNRKKVCYLIWKNPLMTVGGDTFINHILERSGYDNIFNSSTRYPVVSFEMIKNRAPELVFLSSEPFPFNKKHLTEFNTQLPDSKIMLVDGRAFSWYGSHMVEAVKYIHDFLK